MRAAPHPTTSHRRAGGSRRKGLTLFELLLALAIFLASLAALAQLLASGSRAAAQAKLTTEAILRCESKLNELVAGIVPLERDAGGTFADDPNWSWRASVTAGPWPTLQKVEVRVSRRSDSSLGSRSFALQRYVRDPRLFVREARRSAGITGRSRGNGSNPTATPAAAASTTASEDSDG